MKQLVTVLLLFIILVTFTSCNENSNEATSTPSVHSEVSELISSGAPSILDNKSYDEGSQEIKNTVSQEKIIRQLPLSGIQIDAVLYGRELNNSDNYSLTAQFQTPSAETALDFLFANKEIVNESTEKNMNAEGNIDIYEASDGSIMVADYNTLYFDTTKYRSIGTVFLNEKTDPLYNADQFLSMADLSFAAIEEARENIQKIFDAMNIKVSDFYTVYTLDSEEVNKQKAVLEEVDSIQQAYEQEEWQFKRMEWDDSLDCYYFEFYQEINGVIVTPFFHGSFEDGSLTQGASVRVIYSKNQIESLHFEFNYTSLEEQKIGQVISLDDALGLLDQKYSNLILEGEYTVSRILFEYVPVKIKNEENRFTLIPAWSFELDHTFTAEKGMEAFLAGRKETVVFLATAGEEILSDIEG